ncbi:hypothetical protein ACSSS7_003291 [Eimeria intestinalis]
MQSSPQTRARTEKEAAPPTPATGVAPQSPLHPQPDSPKGAVPSSVGTSPQVRKRQRAEPLKARAPRLVLGKFNPLGLKDIRNAKKLAKPKTQDALTQKDIVYLHMRLKAFKGLRNEAWRVARGVQRLPVERGWTAPLAVPVNQTKKKLEDLPPLRTSVTSRGVPGSYGYATLGNPSLEGLSDRDQRKTSTDEAPEPTVGSPTPLSLGGTGHQMRRDGLTSGTPATLAGVADRLREELSPKGPVSAERVADLFRLWLSGTEGLAALLEAAKQPLKRADTVDRQAAELVAQPPPLEPLREGDSPPPLPLPRPHLSPPHALGLHGLANASASSTGNLGGESGGGSSSVELLEAALLAAERHCPRGGDVISRLKPSHYGKSSNYAYKLPLALFLCGSSGWSRCVAWLRPAQHGVPAAAPRGQEARRVFEERRSLGAGN